MLRETTQGLLSAFLSGSSKEHILTLFEYEITVISTKYPNITVKKQKRITAPPYDQGNFRLYECSLYKKAEKSK